MIKSKKQMFLVITLFTLLLIVGGVTYSFFNYTRIGSANTLKVGRISFISRQNETINLTNLFPIDPTETGIMDDTTKVGTVEIEVVGDTDYTDGIEYLVSALNTNITTTTGKLVPISLDVTATNLGTSSTNYFTAREDKNAIIYKKLVGDTLVGDQMLLVGYIKKNTTNGTIEGLNGKLTIKAYLDKNKIAISDTLEDGDIEVPGYANGTTDEWVNGRTVLTTTEWNNLSSTGISFQVKVEANEGIWVEEPLTALDIIKKKVNTTKLIDFGQRSGTTYTSSIDNGNGLYILPGTESDANPIYYYRGAVTDNNVIFGGFCWQMVRTTNTGGIKMIYNGVAKRKDIVLESDTMTDNDIIYTNDEEYPFTYDEETKKWTNVGTPNKNHNFVFQVKTDGDYVIKYILSSNSDYVGFYNGYTTLKIDNGAKSDEIVLKNIVQNDKIKITYSSNNSNNKIIFEIAKVLNKKEGNYQCENSVIEDKTLLTTIFNSNNKSMSDVGYMYNQIYEYENGLVSDSIYGKTVEWDGDNYLVVDDTPNVASTNKTLDANHHYSCGIADTSSCESVRYYYYNKYYITLSNGDKVEDAIFKMTGNGTDETKAKWSEYKLNTTSSVIKTTIENWFANNIISYQNYLEDTVWCNDRRFQTNGSNTLESSGWNPNGGDLNKEIYFNIKTRFKNNWYSTSNVPSMTCPNLTDQFKVGNKYAKLTYPIGLLTADEIILAGAGGNTTDSSNSYIHTGNSLWSMTPYSYGFYSSIASLGYSDFLSNETSYNWYYLRPLISLKMGTEFETGGDGTGTNPYIVKTG